MTVLQTIALPLGYSAIRMARGRVITANALGCQYLDLNLCVPREEGSENEISVLQNGPSRRSWIHPIRYLRACRSV